MRYRSQKKPNRRRWERWIAYCVWPVNWK